MKSSGSLFSCPKLGKPLAYESERTPRRPGETCKARTRKIAVYEHQR
jgi:hypothetical protein